MANDPIPYLCGGTFLAQVLRARNTLATATDHTKGQKESLSEQETFRRLLSIYQLSDFYGGPSLRTYTSQFKSCTQSLEAFAQFSDYDLRRAFDEDVRSEHSAALVMTAEFTSEFIDVKKYRQLVRCLLDLIARDTDIPPSHLFYIHAGGTAVTKNELTAMDTFYLEPFLLGVWHYIILHRARDNKRGASTYAHWYPEKGDYAGTVGDGIARDLTVLSHPAPPKSPECHPVNTVPRAPQASEAPVREELHAAVPAIQNQFHITQNGDGIQIGYAEKVEIRDGRAVTWK